PTAAMLELLDSEQNYAFRDHYIEIPFDLSEVLFITTANTTETIPRPLLDRMEVIELSSYTTEEKFSIAKLHLIKKQMKRHGLTSKMLKIRDSAIYKIIEGYTREAGVRELERTIATLCRKVAKAIVSDENSGCVSVSDVNLQSFLGAPRYSEEHARAQLEPGVVNGLAWTAVGGAILEVEVNIVDGTGKIEITGNLGTVMNESAKAALTYVRSRADAFGIKHDFYKKNDVHIHFPEGAIPKDGPSAGVTIATAIVSALTGVAARATVAMTGEVSIRGRVLPIGGLKEKAMAAYRAGIKTIIIPHENVKDLEELDPIVRAGIEFISAQHVDEVIANAIPLQKETSDTAYSAVIPTAGKNRGIQSIRQ
ncbi:MAG: S16 family serine protease, partial [Clostridia bacterium]